MDYKQLLIDLLCVVHRDGGHYIAEHGLQRAYDDGIEVVLTYYHYKDRYDEDHE